MPHNHNIVEDDNYFVVDAETREILGNTLTLMQYDHNSEMITFEIPKVIEGHEMLQSDRVEVHYTNVGSGTSSSNRKTNPDIYRITDLKENPNDPETLIGTWLISQNATMFSGTTKFLLKFMCEDADGAPTYIWHTNSCTGIEVLAGFENTQSMLDLRPDIFGTYDNRLNDLRTEMSEHSDILSDHNEIIDDLKAVKFKTGGSKAYTILDADFDSNTLYLDSIQGLVVGDTYSLNMQWYEYDAMYTYSSEYDNLGKITEINRRSSRLAFTIGFNSFVFTANFDPNDETTYSGECEYHGEYTGYAAYAIQGTPDFDNASDIHVAVGGEYVIDDEVFYFTDKDIVVSYTTHEDMDDIINQQSTMNPVYTIEHTVTVSEMPVPTHAYSEWQKSDSYIDDHGIDTGLNTFRIMTKPDVGTRTVGTNSICAGDNNNAYSNGAVSMGKDNASYASYSFVEGVGNKALSQAQHVAGKYNVPDPNGKYAYILGNGTSDTERSNAATIDWEGNVHFSGAVSSGDGVLATEDFVLRNSGGGTGSGVFLTNGSGEDAIVQGVLQDKDRAKVKGSSAFGIGTKASDTEGQMVVGTYNDPSVNEEAIFVVGIGTSDNARANGFAIDKDGNSYTFGMAHSLDENGEMVSLVTETDLAATDNMVAKIAQSVRNVEDDIAELSGEKPITWNSMTISGTDGSIGTLTEAGTYEIYADVYFVVTGGSINRKVSFGTMTITSVTNTNCMSSYGAIKLTGSDVDGAYVNVDNGGVYIRCEDKNDTTYNLGQKVSPNSNEVSKLYYRKIRSV